MDSCRDEEGDLEAARKEFPYIVRRKTHESLNLDIGIWICENVGDDMVIISKETSKPAWPSPFSFSSVIITYGFRYEHDAIAFKIKFAT